jgi:aspartate kinase
VIVMKFGGSSVESAEAIRHVAATVRDHGGANPIVVVSAMGKTTNQLLALARAAVNGAPYEEDLQTLRDFHFDQTQQLVSNSHTVHEHVRGLFGELEQLLAGLAILGELTPRSQDAIASYGERLSSLIVAAAFCELGLDVAHVDSRDIVVTDGRHTQAAPNFPETNKRLQEMVRTHGEKTIVMGGFIAANADGVTTTLGRGGSDYSAAIIGAAIHSEEIQIWTDVDGMMTTDPRLIPTARPVAVISYSEAAELAYFGAKVLHPATIRPAVEANIPLVILNSRRPDAAGTRILQSPVYAEGVVKAIAFKRRITMVNIHSARMFMAHGFLRRVFEVFDRHETSIDMVTTSEVNVSVTLDDPNALDPIRSEIEQFAEVQVEHGFALVSVVGEGIGDRVGVASRIFKALEHVNVRMISQGASHLNLSLLIAEQDLEQAMQSLHHEWFEEALV